jgi:small GTP-binding protein
MNRSAKKVRIKTWQQIGVSHFEVRVADRQKKLEEGYWEMIQKKICMLGAFAVGKTSLISRFVKSIFSEKYLTTVGVKIEKKALTVGSQDVSLMLWDLAGEDEFLQVRMSYVRGSSGYFLVADGTRCNTLDTMMSLQQRVEESIGQIPFIVLLNKVDLREQWEIDDAAINELMQKGWPVFLTSARTGAGVEDAFLVLTKRMLES